MYKYISIAFLLLGNLLISNLVFAQNKQLQKSAATLKKQTSTSPLKPSEVITNKAIIDNIPVEPIGRPLLGNEAVASDFIVKDIVVEGLTDIEPQTVFTYLPIKAGDVINQEKIQQSVKSLFATGLFDDVAISRKNDVLVVNVVERKVLGKLNIEGVYEFPVDSLRESLRGVGLFEGKTYDPVLLARAEQELKNQYISKGFYSTKITQVQTPIDSKRVEVTLKVAEGQVARIRGIKIFGNKQVSTSTILGLMDSTDRAYFFSSKDKFSSQRLEADMERIRRYFLNNGYIDFQMDSAQVSVSEDLNDIYISLGLQEGDQYTVRGVELGNPSDAINEETFNGFNSIKVGEVFSQKKAEQLAGKVARHLSTQGFAFPDVEFQKIKNTNIAEKNVLLRYMVAENRRMTINKITITGNTRTSDEVIRREFRIKEGDLFNSLQIEQSRRRIEKLGHFSDVQVTPQKVAGSADQMDVVAKIVEKRTGQVSFGVTSSNVDKVGFNAKIQQNNWGGTGKEVALSFNTTKSARAVNASYYDPYFTDWGLGLGANIYQTLDDSSSLSTGKYKNLSKGAGVRVNYPLTDDSAIGLGVRASVNEYTLFNDSPTLYKEQAEVFGSKPKDFVWTFSYAIDLRDSYIYPMSGFYAKLYTENTLNSSDFKYHREFLTLQGYIPVTENIAVLLNTDISKATSIKGRPLPYSKFLYMGGIGSVRGYEYGSLGPYDSATGRYSGGDRAINANIEILFPFPGQARSREARLALFADTGMAWGVGESLSDRKFKSSWGGALSWTSPIGPLRFSYAFPINKQPRDRTEQFQFQIGTTF